MGALLVDGRCPKDDRLSGNDPDCPPAAGDSLVVTKFDYLARSLPRCPSPPGHRSLTGQERTRNSARSSAPTAPRSGRVPTPRFDRFRV